jgi:hypothetical protein
VLDANPSLTLQIKVVSFARNVYISLDKLGRRNGGRKPERAKMHLIQHQFSNKSSPPVEEERKEAHMGRLVVNAQMAGTFTGVIEETVEPPPTWPPPVGRPPVVPGSPPWYRPHPENPIANRPEISLPIYFPPGWTGDNLPEPPPGGWQPGGGANRPGIVQPIAGIPGPDGKLLFYNLPGWGWVAKPASGSWADFYPPPTTEPPPVEPTPTATATTPNPK